MDTLGSASCPNEQCQEFGVIGRGNIAVRATYGKDRQRKLLYCRSCGRRFSQSRATPFFGLHLPKDVIVSIIHHAAEGVGVRATARLVGVDKDTVNRVILRAGEHCRRVLSNLLVSLHLTEIQFDELYAFVKKKKLLESKKSRLDTAERGSGPPSTRQRDCSSRS